MSNTRTAAPGAELAQGRFASSLQTGALLGNLVTKKCQAVGSAHHRRLILFLQDLSLRAGWRNHPTANLFPAWPWRADRLTTGATAFDCVAEDLKTLFPGEIQNRKSLARLPQFLTKLCLDPALDPLTVTFPGIASFIELLEKYRLAFCEAARTQVASTAPTRIVWESLDYALNNLPHGGIVLIEGAYRVGKSYSSQAWSLAHLGECRYVQLTSDRTEVSFYRSLSRALGLACSTQRKAAEMRLRIELTVTGQKLLLVLDEGQWALPTMMRPTAAPERLNFILSSLVNNGVAVALVCSKDFTRLMSNLERKLPIFGSEQFYGRLRLRKQLPDSLDENDLFRIARAVMPEATDAMEKLLVGHALQSKGKISAIENAVTRARYFAGRARRSVSFPDLSRALVEAGTLSETDLRRPAATAPRVARDVSAPPDILRARGCDTFSIKLPAGRTVKDITRESEK